MSTWRQHLRETYQNEARDHLESLEPDNLSDDEHETVLRQQWLETVQNYTPDATLPEELLVRLSGQRAQFGSLDFELGEVLLKPLVDGLSVVADQELSLELTGLSMGSTVLHVRALPTQPSSVQGDVSFPSAMTPADTAVRNFLRMVSAAESESDLREWTRAYGSLDNLVQALDKFDLSIGFRWFSMAGPVRSTALTERGRRYVRSLRDVSEKTSMTIVRGRITELRAAGIVKVKTGSSRNSAAYDIRVDANRLIGMHLELGQQVAFHVEVVRRYDKLGRERSSDYSLTGFADTPLSITDKHEDQDLS